jgi:hypothetical protein
MSLPSIWSNLSTPSFFISFSTVNFQSTTEKTLIRGKDCRFCVTHYTKAMEAYTVQKDHQVLSVAETSRDSQELAQLASHPWGMVRDRVSRNSHASPETLAAFAQCRFERAGVAKNPSTPAATLWELCEDPDDNVRIALADHPRPPPGLLERLGASPGHGGWLARERLRRAK